MRAPLSPLPPMPGPLPLPRALAPGSMGVVATLRNLARAIRAHPAEVLAFTWALALCGWCVGRPFGALLAAVVGVGSAEFVLLSFAEHPERPVGRVGIDALSLTAGAWAAVLAGGTAYHVLPAGSWGLPVPPALDFARFGAAFAVGSVAWGLCAGAWWPAVRPPTVTEFKTEWRRASTRFGMALGGLAALLSVAFGGAYAAAPAIALRGSGKGGLAAYVSGGVFFAAVGLGVVAGKGVRAAWPRVQAWLGRVGQ